MNEAEFDKFADEYHASHARNIRASGETPEFFAEYKVKDVADFICRSIPPDRFDGGILDFGCGVGTSTGYFRRCFPKAALFSVDVSTKSLAVAKQRFPEESGFRAFNGRNLPFEDGSLDIAFAACVYHHIDHALHVGLLTETRRVLKPGGRVFIFEHNPLNPLTVRAVNDCEFDGNAVLMTAPTLARRLCAAGFEAVETRYRIFFPGALRALRPLERWLTWLPLGAQYFVTGAKTG